MKREILCNNCGEKFKKKFPNESPYPGEYIKFIRGIAKNKMTCDKCSCSIKKGDIAYCVSIWTDHGGIKYYPWESEFIDIEGSNDAYCNE